jgi:hypothetical protein
LELIQALGKIKIIPFRAKDDINVACVDIKPHTILVDRAPKYVRSYNAVGAKWPAAGFVDTEIRCLTELESGNAKKEVQPRVQA